MSTSILLRATKITGMVLALSVTKEVPAAVIRIINGDGPGEGFNDSTPAAPVAGNPGTTIGAQRLFVFQMAANQWGSLLASPVGISVQAAFDPLSCTSTGSVLGAAGALGSFANFSGAPFPDTLYHSALANSIAGRDLDTRTADIRATFNPYTSTACLSTGIRWWYGVNPPAPMPTATDRVQALFPVLLHELAHGLGFANQMTSQSGAYLMGTPPIWANFLYDLSQFRTWVEMVDDEPPGTGESGDYYRSISSTNDGNLVWSGINVVSNLSSFLGYKAKVTAYSPDEDFLAEQAGFGPAPPYPAGVTRNIILVNDGSTVVPLATPMPTTLGTLSDGCNAPFANAVQIRGNIALLDRG
jgi:hypothetical protein